MGHSVTLISTLAAGFAAAWFFGFLAEKIKMPSLVGYLLAGVLISPQVSGLNVDLDLANQLSEIGIMLLMFGSVCTFPWAICCASVIWWFRGP